MAIVREYDTAVVSPTGIQWSQSNHGSAREALAFGLEWAADRIRNNGLVLSVRVSETVIDNDYGNTVSEDRDLIVVSIDSVEE